jgi:hypothetical protein
VCRDLYGQGPAVRQIGAELGGPSTAWAINFAALASPSVAAVLAGHIEVCRLLDGAVLAEI